MAIENTDPIIGTDGKTIVPGDLVILNDKDGNEPRMAIYRGMGPMVATVYGYWCEWPKHDNKLLYSDKNKTIKKYESSEDFVPAYAKKMLDFCHN